MSKAASKSILYKKSSVFCFQRHNYKLALSCICYFPKLKWSWHGAAVVQWTATRQPRVRFLVGSVKRELNVLRKGQ